MAKPKKWKIEGRDAPSTLGYLAVLAKYHARRSAWVRSIVEASRADPQAIPARVAAGGPQPPTAAAIVAANAGPARMAARGARRSVLAVGPPPQVIGALGIMESGAVPGIDLILGGVERASLERWAADGLGYIQRLPAERIEPFSSRLAEAVARGDRWESIQAIVADEMQVEGRHLRLIARDQVAKLNGRITQDLQGAAGIQDYIWRTSRDGRVRDSHKRAADKTWSWAEGAPGVGFYGESGHPGQCGQCRCTAEGIPPEWWGATNSQRSPEDYARAIRGLGGDTASGLR